MAPLQSPPPPDPLDLPARLAAAWPAEAWRDVHVLAAVSGGADSMALLRALSEAKRRSGGAGQVFAAHVNHGLRGAESDGDERWLVDECRRLDVPLEVRRIDAPALTAAGDGLEAAARDARYRLLVELAEATGARYVATAHMRDDQVETVLFRLVRGTGLRGLAGMRAARTLSPTVVLVRPLLDCSRVELRAYLESLGQTWREDRLNQDLHHARNRIRTELLPYLREDFNPEVDAAIVRTASLMDEVQELVETLAGDLLARCERPDSTGITLAVAPMVGQPTLLVVESLRLAWRQAGWPEQAMTYAWWRKLTHLALSTESPGTLNLPGDVLARRRGELLVLAPAVGMS